MFEFSILPDPCSKKSIAIKSTSATSSQSLPFPLILSYTTFINSKLSTVTYSAASENITADLNRLFESEDEEKCPVVEWKVAKILKGGAIGEVGGNDSVAVELWEKVIMV